MKNTRGFILDVLDVLKEYTDENRYLCQAQIIDILKEKGIEADRRSVSASIKELINKGYDINNLPRKGVALLNRGIDKSEAEYLLHVIYSSKVITSKSALRLAKEIEKDFSIYDQKDYSHLYKSGEISRTNNSQVFYSIDVIEEAIRTHSKVSFQYVSIDENLNEKPRKNGKRYLFSPYYIFVNNGSFFVIGNSNGHDYLSIYRLEKIKEIKIEEEEAMPLASIDPDFKIETYLQDHIYPFLDEVCIVKLTFRNKGLINQIKGWFGKNAKIEKVSDCYIAEVRNGIDCLYIWLTHYADGIKVIEPELLRKRITEYGRSVIDNNLD